MAWRLGRSQPQTSGCGASPGVVASRDRYSMDMDIRALALLSTWRLSKGPTANTGNCRPRTYEHNIRTRSIHDLIVIMVDSNYL